MSHSARWYLEVGDRILGGLGARTRPVLGRFAEETGNLEGIDLNLLQLGYGFAPEPITPQHVIKRVPYGNPDAIGQQVQDAAERGWLAPAGEGQYLLTPRGKEVAEGLFALVDTTLGALRLMPNADLERICAFLQKVVDRVAALAEPQEKWAFSWGARFDRGPAAPALVRARRRMLDLLAFRDDAHIAAWQPYDIDGRTWEAFTFVWRSDAGSAAELAEKLPYRHYDQAAYGDALSDLASRGWIAEELGAYTVTEVGRALRQEAEDATNRIFDAPWVALDDSEVTELRSLLKTLADAAQPPDEEAS